MGWDVRSDRGHQYVFGPVGDRLGFTVRGHVAGLNGHTWLAQIRCSGTLISTLTLTADASSSTDVSLDFVVPSTVAWDHDVEYQLGIRATAGALAPYTLCSGVPIRTYEPTAHA